MQKKIQRQLQAQIERWLFRGKIVGTIVTEVVLAVCTFGERLAVQVIAKLGHYQIVQFTRRKEVDGDYSEGKEQKSDSRPQNRAPKSITSRVKEDSQLLKLCGRNF